MTTDPERAGDDEHMPQELADIFFAIEDGQGDVDQAKLDELRQLADADLGPEAFQ